MSDPLSVAASIAGLISVALTVGKALAPYVTAARDTPKIAIQVHAETQGATIILYALQILIENIDKVPRSRTALIQVDHIITVLTNGVIVFSELEDCVSDLPGAPEPSITGLGLRSRLGWARKETALVSLLSRLEGFKSTISAILNILQSDSVIHVEHSQQELTAHVTTLLNSNKDLSRRLGNLEDIFDARSTITKTRRTSISSVSSEAPTVEASLAVGDGHMCTQPSTTAFEMDLEDSRVYQRALNSRISMDFSIHSSVTRTHSWSIFSGLSLDDISALSVLALPIFSDDIRNPYHYSFQNRQSPSQDQHRCMCLMRESTDNVIAQHYTSPLWNECVEIEKLLLQIEGFQPLFIEAREQDMHKHPFLVLRDAFRQGYTLLLLLNAVEDHGWTLQTLTQTKGLQTDGKDPPEISLQKGIDTMRKMLPGTAIFGVNDVVGSGHHGLFYVIPVVKDLLIRLVQWDRINPLGSDTEPASLQDQPKQQHNQCLPRLQLKCHVPGKTSSDFGTHTAEY